MAVTRIRNNQITDSSAGNTIVGINAGTKLQNYSITATKIANNLTYGSDLTVAGNLTVQGNTTAIDTTITTIEDPVIVLASTQTGSPTVDIGFIGERGTSDNIAFVWDESAGEFVTAFTSTSETNTTITISSYANIHVANANIGSNMVVNGTTSLVGNLIGAVNATGNITGGNLLTSGQVSATSNITGGNLLTGGLISSTGTITSATTITGGNLFTGGNVSATGNITGGNIISGNAVIGNINVSGDITVNSLTSNTFVSASGNVVGGNVLTGGLISSTGTITSATTITGGNVATGGTVSATGTVTGGNLATGGTISGTGNITGGNVLTGGLVSATGTVTGGNLETSGTVSATGNVTGGNVLTGGAVSATGNITSSANVSGGNVLTGGIVSATGTVTGGNLATGGTVSATGTVTGGNLATGGTVSATGNVTGGNVLTGGDVSATGNISGGNISTSGAFTAASFSTAGNITGGNLLTGGLISSTGTITSATTVTGGNLATGGTVSATGNATLGNVLTGGLVSATGNVTGGNVNTSGVVNTPTLTNASLLTISTASGDLDLAPAGNINASSNYINNVLDPVLAQDAATKQYVDDAVSSGIHIHTPVYVETPVALPSATYAQGGNTFTVNQTIAGNTVVFTSAASLQPNDQLWFSNSFEGILANTAYFVVSTPNTSAAVLSTTYNGAPVSNITSNTGLSQSVRVNSGIGATLTATANGNLIIDGVTVSTTQRILVYQQANAVQNGVYVVTQTGNVSAPWILTRASDADTYEPDSSTGLDEGSYFYVQAGDTGAGESYVQTAPTGPFIIGFANLTFTQFSASQVYTANTAAGLSLTGTVFSAKVDNDTTAFDGTGNIIVKAGANLVTPNIGAATGTSLSLTGAVTAASTVGGIITGSSVSVTGAVTAASTVGGIITGSSVSVTGDVTGGNLATSGTVSAAGTATVGNLATGGTVSATGTVTGGNLATGGTVSATGNATVGNLSTAGQVIATANITGGNILTAGAVSATGNGTFGNVSTAGTFTAASFSTAGNITGGNLLTGGLISSTGTITSATTITGGNLATGGTVSATGTVTGGNLATGGTVSATGTATVGNLDTGGTVSATGTITGGNIATGGTVSATGNITGGNIISGNAVIGNINVSGDITVNSLTSNTYVSSTGNVISGNVLTSGLVSATGTVTGGNLATGGTISGTGNITGGNVLTGGLISATGDITSAANVSGGNVLTGGLVSATGTVTGGNLATGGTVSATGNVTGGNLISSANLTITGGNIFSSASAITVNGNSGDVNFAVNGDTTTVFFVDAGTETASFGSSTQTVNAIVAFNSTNSILVPVGNTAQRPDTGVTGMQRFNTTTNALEIYNNSQWQAVGATEFTVIGDEQFNGDGSTVAFTLGSTQTTNSCIVSINGVVQIPTIAYSVAGTDPTCVLTFTEAPAAGDIIDVRQITTTVSVTKISNSQDTAIIAPVDGVGSTEITGNLIPTANVTFDLGNSTNRWKDGYFSGTTLVLGNVVMKNEAGGNTIAFYGPDGSTPATIASSSVDTTQIANGTSSLAVIASGGNIRANVGGTTVQTISAGLVAITGDLSVTGNATLSGNILGDRVQNGTTSIDIQTPSGNANITVGGTSNVAVFATTGLFVTGLTSVTGNITGGNISVGTGTITGGNIVNANANGVGNIGSATTYFNTVFAKATSAQYADLAEKYTADANYAPGTVVMFGGSAEVTLCVNDACSRVAGVISTNPSYRMNDGLQGEHTAMVALTGRVPTRVTGTVRKGDMMVSAGNGVARAEANPQIGTVIGKALADSEGDAVIEVVVGRV